MVIMLRKGGINMLKVSAIADFFIYKSQFDEKPSYTITPLKLQKLIYYSQAWYLAIEGDALFSNDIEAWVHGPVIPEIYHEYKKYGYNQIRKTIDHIPEEITSNAKINKILHSVWEIYKDFDAKELEKLTHSEEPWKHARKGLEPYESSNNIIKPCDMEAYYGKFVNRNKNEGENDIV